MGLTPAAISALGTVGGALINAGSSAYARHKDAEMIRYQNDYNSPRSQMLRYAQAGLNPNLVYSQGTPGNQMETAKYQVPHMDAGAAVQNALTAMSTISNIKLQDKQAEGIDSENALRAAKTSYTMLQEVIADRKMPYEIKLMMTQALLNEMQSVNVSSQTRLNEQTHYQRGAMFADELENLRLRNRKIGKEIELDQYHLDNILPNVAEKGYHDARISAYQRNFIMPAQRGTLEEQLRDIREGIDEGNWAWFLRWIGRQYRPNYGGK